MINETVKKNVEELLEKEPSSELVKASIKELRFQKTSKWQYLFSAILSVIFGLIIGISQDTVTVMENVVGIFNNIDIAFIAMIIGAYSIFQALLSDNFLIALVRTENNLLKISNKSFFNLIVLYLAGIVVNIMLMIFFSLIDNQWILFKYCLGLNNGLAAILCILYLFYNILLILEIKNFGLNLYRMFNASNSQRIIDILTKED